MFLWFVRVASGEGQSMLKFALWVLLAGSSIAVAAEDGCFCLLDSAENAIKDCERVRSGAAANKVLCHETQTGSNTIDHPERYKEVAGGKPGCQPCRTPKPSTTYDEIRSGARNDDAKNGK